MQKQLSEEEERELREVCKPRPKLTWWEHIVEAWRHGWRQEAWFMLWISGMALAGLMWLLSKGCALVDL